MDRLLGAQIGLEDFIFAHIKGKKFGLLLKLLHFLFVKIKLFLTLYIICFVFLLVYCITDCSANVYQIYWFLHF